MKYKVTVTRIGYRETTIEVEAENYQGAKEAALEAAGGVEFPNEYDAEYAVENIEKINEKKHGH